MSYRSNSMICKPFSTMHKILHLEVVHLFCPIVAHLVLVPSKRFSKKKKGAGGVTGKDSVKEDEFSLDEEG